MIGKHAWQAQILDVIRYVLLLQHPSDLEEVTSRENANLSTIKTGSIVLLLKEETLKRLIMV